MTKTSSINQTLRQMSSQSRQIIAMSQIYSLTSAEIALIIGLPESSVKKQLLKALAKCQDAVKSEWD